MSIDFNYFNDSIEYEICGALSEHIFSKFLAVRRKNPNQKSPQKPDQPTNRLSHDRHASKLSETDTDTEQLQKSVNVNVSVDFSPL